MPPNAASPTEQPGHLEALRRHGREVRIGAANCPENFQNRAAMIDAENAPISGRDLDAIYLYESLNAIEAMSTVENRSDDARGSTCGMCDVLGCLRG
jgi:hypothetical protein